MTLAASPIARKRAPTVSGLHKRPTWPASSFPPRQGERPPALLEGIPMLKYAIIFGIIALITGGLGFSKVSGIAGTLAKICFAIFLILFVIAILAVIGVFKLAF
ncbi:MAG: DUF1328 domain-containing protein, partial [Luteibacter sp.]